MAGTQWIGDNGNRYIADASGVRNVGKASATGGKYWTDRGYMMEMDPNSQKGYTNQLADSNANWIEKAGGAPAPSQGGGGAGGGQQFVDTSAQRAAAQASLDSLGTVQANRYAQEQQAYDNLLAEYAQERAKEQGRYSEQTTQNEISLDKQNQAAMLAAAQGGRGLRATLAAMGALGGTGTVLADRAIQDSANKDLGGAKDNFETNAKTLQTAWGDFEDQDKKRQRDAGNVLAANKQAVDADILTTRQKLLQDLAGYWEKAGNNAQYGAKMAEATALTPQIAQNSRPTAQAFTAQAASFNPADLSSYLAGNRDMTVGRQAGGAGANPALNNPLYAFSQKKDKELV